MTERLYFHDSFLRVFDAQVLSSEQVGDRVATVLDRTAFYPTSGGQPFDTGHLGEASVVEVVEEEDGRIIHWTDRVLPPGTVHGEIDWERRFDHMQQHTGQHLLSAAFASLFNFPTVSFHLGRQVATIDLEARSLVQRHMDEAERLTNRVIFEDRPVSIRFRTAQELAGAGVRKMVEREGPLRVLEIEGFDLQPCGGTHVARTGQVGLVMLRKSEKIKQNWRIEFVCGARALAAARADYAALGEAAGVFSCGMGDVPAMVRKLVDENKGSQRSRLRLLEQLAEYESRALLAAETVTAGGRIAVQRAGGVITRLFDDADAAYLRMLAARLVAEPGLTVLLGARSGGHVVFAQSRGGAADMTALLRETLGAFGGKGGGSHDFAQGQVPPAAPLDTVLARAVARLT